MKVWELREALEGADPDALVETAVLGKYGHWRSGPGVLSAEAKMGGGGSQNYPAFVLDIDLVDEEG